MNDILQAMETRRSIRQFKPDMPRSSHPAGTAGCSGPNKQAQKRNGIPDGVPFLFVLNLPRRRCPASRHW